MQQVARIETTSSDERQQIGGLNVDGGFFQFVEQELLPAIGMDSGAFWSGVESIISDLTPENRQLLSIRDELQASIDGFHRRNPGATPGAYRAFLEQIGYLVPEGDEFTVQTEDADPEIASIAGPQLVVPVSNARFAINAANARWGSLYDAFYGTDVIDEENGKTRATDGYNAVRGDAVIQRAIAFLDRTIPLRDASHADVERYTVEIPLRNAECFATLKDGRKVRLIERQQFAGWQGYGDDKSLLFCNNGLHIILECDPDDAIGRDAPGFLSNVILESALTTIQDCEDSVAAVDSEDKTQVYRNWLGLMQGTLKASFDKNGNTVTRRLDQDRKFIARDGNRVVLPGTSLMLVRNVGHLMTTDAIQDADGNDVFEGLLDAIVTTAAGISNNLNRFRRPNSATGSIYIVKPKMHGPDEAAFANTLFDRVEDLYGLARNTIKIGVMDEERRTTVNLRECIRAVKDRIVFINTGFLDRTGDEIHTSMQAGPFKTKDMIKQQAFIHAYEDWNVDNGIGCGFRGKAQIGKGMWPKPDEMAQMLARKAEHPRAGASCAWVPSPTAATLHAMHYHETSVAAVQEGLAERERASLDDILTPPLATRQELDVETVAREVENNAQSILGYVVRWIDSGVGCSKVPDINDVGLMEDRATLRISSQLLANWLLHGVCNENQVMSTFKRMAAIVDRQNAGTPGYEPMSDDFDNSIAFRAACDLVFKGASQPSGYTEPLLHAYRIEKKTT
ncbi:MAG: malate synthase G [Pseudomonadota bacterium]